MTQPAAPGPFPQQAGDPRGPADAEVQEPPRTPLWWWAITAAAGIPVGLLWWVLAPSGLNLLSGDPAMASGTNVSTWLIRDLVLAGLFLLAGCVTGVLVSGNRPEGPSTRSVLLAVGSAAAGALLAWGVGVLAGAWWGPAPDPAGHDGSAFSLRSYPLLALWPAVAAFAVFLGFAVGKPVPAPETGADPVPAPETGADPAPGAGPAHHNVRAAPPGT